MPHPHDPPVLYADHIAALVKLRDAIRHHERAARLVTQPSRLSLSYLRRRGELVAAKRALRSARTAVDAQNWEPLMVQLVHQALDRARDDHWRNPYSCWTLHRLGSVAARVVSYLSGAAVSEPMDSRMMRQPQVLLRELPVLRRYYADREWVCAVIAAEIYRRNDIARTDDYINTTPTGTAAVTVQHRPTGLRIRLTPDAAGPGIGIVDARDYKITSIDPEHPERPLDYSQWAGLGVGTELYRRGALLLPQQRWASSAAKNGAPVVRRRLHAGDPFTWNAGCTWCDTNGVNWIAATRATFVGHPEP